MLGIDLEARLNTGDDNVEQKKVDLIHPLASLQQSHPGGDDLFVNISLDSSCITWWEQLVASLRHGLGVEAIWGRE